MNLRGSTMRTAVLVAFLAACLTFTGYLYAQAGGALPGMNRAADYRVSFEVTDLDNLVTYADVMEAGVVMGKVESLDRHGPNSIRVTLRLDETGAPLHQGATVQIGEKSLAGQPNVKIVDGAGPEIPDGTLLAPSAVLPAVQLRDVIAGLDSPTRASLSSAVRSLGQGTDGRQRDINGLVAGMADVGANGDTALDALAAQSDDLAQISQQLSQVWDALDTGQGQIMQLVSSADRLTSATARQRPALEDSMRKIPGVLDSTDTASDGINRIADAFTPVAADLRRAAPDLNEALDDLPGASRDLRDLMPVLHSVMDKAPDTLHKVPDFGDRAREVFPTGVSLMRDLNPTLAFMKPYARDIATFFPNFDGPLHHYADDGGAYAYVRPNFGAGTLRPDPVELPKALLQKNPYPKPGERANPKPFDGEYPRVEREGE